jgi:hypothetical protein
MMTDVKYVDLRIYEKFEARNGVGLGKTYGEIESREKTLALCSGRKEGIISHENSSAGNLEIMELHPRQ